MIFLVQKDNFEKSTNFRNNKLWPTMGIKHRADSGFCKFSALSKLGFGRTNKCFEMPYVSYPRLVSYSKVHLSKG